MSETAPLKQPAAGSPAEPVALRAVPAPVPLVVGTAQPLTAPPPPLALVPATQPAAYRQAVQRQQAAASPVFLAATLRHGVNLEHQHQAGQFQRQIAGLQAALPDGAEQAALHRAQERASVPTVPGFYASKPPAGSSPAFSDVAGLYRYEAHEVQKTDNGRGVLSQPLRAIQRRAVGQFASAYRGSRTPVLQRAQELGTTLATVQRMPFGSEVASVVTSRPGGLPASDLPLIQRALNEADAALVRQEQQDGQVQHLHDLQRQLAEHAGQQEQTRVLQRVREREGAGDPLPETVQRHLETGLNADLSKVRIHTDAEADGLAKGVQAQAFTSGRDIYFRSGQFQPNTKSGLELLGHELTHVVQQGQGRVGAGMDPDAGLEQQARESGRRLAERAPDPSRPVPPAKTDLNAAWKPPQFQPSPYAPGVYMPQAALQRAQDGAVASAYLHPFLSLQRLPDGTIQRGPFDFVGDAWNATGGKVVNAVGDMANKGVEWAKAQLAGLLGNIPGYRPLCLTFGKDLVTGKAMDQNPSAILDALAGFVPGPLKEMIARLRETNAIPKAWEWFKGELGKLDLGGVLGDVAGAIAKLPPDLDRAKNAVTSRISRLEQLVVGSVRKIAEIALDAVAAGLGPAAQRVIAALKKSGDTIVKVLQNPGSFAKHLIDAVGQGFKQFSANAPKHLAQGVGQWLTGTSGISFPDKLDFQGVFMTVLSVLGLTYQNFRAKLVKSVGAEKVAKAEKTVDVVQGLASRGLHAAEEMKGSQAEVGNQVKTEVIGEIRNSVIIAAVQKIVTMFVPGGGFVSALISAFDTVSFLMDKARDLVALGMSVINSVGQIAAGNVSAAASGVERSIALSIPVALNFLSKLLHLGNIGGKVKGIITKLKAKLDGLVDRVMKRVSSLIDKVLGKLPGGKDKKDAKTKLGENPAAEKDKDHDKKVAIGLSQIQAQEKALAKNGKLSKKNAEKIANDVLKKNNVFRAINVVDGGNTWKFHWFASEGTLEGMAKLATTMDNYSIEFKCKPSLDFNEFSSQIKIQEAKMRGMTIKQWMANRDSFFQRITVQKAKGVKNPQGRDPKGDVMAQQIRNDHITAKAQELLEDGKAISPADAEKQATQFYSDKAAIHRLDQIAGGDGTDFVGMGDARVDYSIGAAWRTRAARLQKHIETNIDPDCYDQVKMNVTISVRKG